MNRELLEYFMFFLIRDGLPAGVIAEALQNAEKNLEYEGMLKTDTVVTEQMLSLAEAFADRFN